MNDTMTREARIQIAKTLKDMIRFDHMFGFECAEVVAADRIQVKARITPNGKTFKIEIDATGTISVVA